MDHRQSGVCGHGQRKLAHHACPVVSQRAGTLLCAQRLELTERCRVSLVSLPEESQATCFQGTGQML